MRLNAVVTVTEELALAQAAQADKEIKSGKYRGPLHGIPWGAKDLFATKGIVTSFGAAPYQNQIIDYDAAVVERLRDAGAVLVAGSMGALAQGDRWSRADEEPWNPDDPQRGGASGSSAALARRRRPLVGFAIGTETRGSIISHQRRTGSSACVRPTGASVVTARWP